MSLSLTNRRVFIDYLGCDRRKLDTQRIINFLQANQFEITTDIASAGLCIFITCGFDETHQQWTIAKLNRICHSKSSTTPIIIGGCLPVINPKILSDRTHYIPLGVRQLEQLDRILNARVSITSISDPNQTRFDHEAADEEASKEKHADSGDLITPAHLAYQYAKRKFKIRINEGCLGNCSFCVTRLATGSLTSKPLTLILEEFQRGLKEGNTIFFLTGGDSGAWGQDIGENIVSLFRSILETPGEFRIYVHDFGIQWVIQNRDTLIPLMRRYARKLGGICFPVQSGSTTVLQRMRRAYTAEAATEVFLRLRREVPTLQIGTHIIVGFPGETEFDLECTITMIQIVKFDFLIVLRYTDHNNADSVYLSGKINDQTKRKRHKAVLDTYRSICSNLDK